MNYWVPSCIRKKSNAEKNNARNRKNSGTVGSMGNNKPSLEHLSEEDRSANKEVQLMESCSRSNNNNYMDSAPLQQQPPQLLREEEAMVSSPMMMMMTGVSSPCMLLSPPALTSTPSVPSGFAYQSRVASRVQMQQAAGRKELMDLDELALNKIFDYLSDQDLRAVHQVSKKWKAMLERCKVNGRRIELVEKIRRNKENIPDMSKGVAAAVDRVTKEKSTTVDLKPGSALLNNCTNTLSNASTAKESASDVLTPPSRLPFQIFGETEKTLSKDQILYQCRRCRGPVPSPIMPMTSPSSGTGASNLDKIEATKCRLTSRMETTPPGLSGSKLKMNQERKRSKNCSPRVPVMDTPTTISLSERMQNSLVISGAGNASYSDQQSNVNHSSGKITPLRSKSPYINLSNSSLNSSIDIQLNFTNSMISTSFGYLRIHSSRNATPHVEGSKADSHLHRTTSDFGSFDSESMCDSGGSFFLNLIPSPEPESRFLGLLPASRHNKSTLMCQQGDFMKPVTLLNSSKNNSFLSPSQQAILQIEKNDIESSTYYQRRTSQNNSNDINVQRKEGQHNSSFILCGDKERRQLDTKDASRSLTNPLSVIITDPESHGISCTSSTRSTSDYYSWRSVMRHEIDSKSFVSEPISEIGIGAHSNRHLVDVSYDKKLRSQSLGSVIESFDGKDPSFESFSSCPNLSESFILECPNPKCSYRFCSSCFDGEHPGRPCRTIDSESMEELHQSCDINNGSLTSLKVTEARVGRGKGNKGVASSGSTSNNKGVKSSKEKLRRIARL